MNDKELLIDLYGKKRGNEIYKRDMKRKLIMEETIAFIEKRWKEEFPDDIITDNIKPYAYDWFNSRPVGC